MDEDGNPIIKNTGDINIDTTTYFQDNTQDINDNGEYIYEQNENGAWHLVLKPQSSTEPTDVNIDIPPPTITSPIENNGYYKFNGNTLINGTSSDYNLNVNVSNIRKIDTIKIGLTTITDSSENWHWFPNAQPYNVSGGQEVLIICKNGDWWNITFHYNLNSNKYSTITIIDNSWVYINNLNLSPYMIQFIENNQVFYIMRDDSEYDPAYCDFYKTIEFNIDWMTFN